MNVVTDSIAVKVVNKDTILRGVGNELHCSTTIQSRPSGIKLRGKVHGIAVESTCAGGDQRVLLYGEKQFMVLQCSLKEEPLFKLVYEATLTDWISSAKFLSNGEELVLLTAHSVLLRWITNECKLLEKCTCADKSTLYCSFMHGEHWEKLVVFGGNAFGELLIWQPIGAAHRKGKLEAPLLQRLPAHNGVIFSIDYSEKFSLLTTTSDDRSIRFWCVQLSDDHWTTARLSPTASGYGHVARVFQAKIIDHDNQPYAITVGEDSYFCIWRHSADLLFKRRQHFGATMWNLAYDVATQTLFTVGSTGNLLAYGLADILKNEPPKMLTLAQVNEASPAEYIAKVRFLARWVVVGVTNKNSLRYASLDEQTGLNQNTKWLEVSDFAKYKCTVLEVFQQLIVLCGYKRLTLYKFTIAANDLQLQKLYDDEILPGVIRTFQFLNAASFLVSDEAGNCLLIKGTDMKQRENIELPKCKERWLTTALQVDEDFLLLSNRLGNLLLYKLNTEVGSYTLNDTLKHPHGYLGATVLRLLESTIHQAFVSSAGHDGCLKLISIDKLSGKLATYSRHFVPVAWIESVLPVLGVELLLGFNDNHFVAWSKHRDFHLQLPCGGGHRCWHYFISPPHIQLVFVKNKRVLWYKLKLFNDIQTHIKLPPQNEWHVRCCNALSILRASEGTLLISAGDDNLIKVTQHSRLSGILVQICEIHEHISNIRALKIYKLADTPHCLIFSGGGRAQLCVTKLNLENFRAQSLVNYTVKDAKADASGAYSLDTETRIMACDVFPLNNATEFLIFIGCSDGYVRKLYMREDHAIVMEKQLFYGKCVLQVRLINRDHVLIGATDGYLQLYDFGLNKLLLKVTLHASGINALDTRYEPEHKTVHLLTGGDDQKVCYTKLSLEEQPTLLSCLELPSLHSAQVTATQLSYDEETCDLLALTSGVDQTLIRYNLSKAGIDRVYHTPVADVKGVCVSQDRTCFIYGCGLDVYNFE